MVGSHRVRVWNNKVGYDFTIKRNITVIEGDSGTGKSVLVKLLDRYAKGSSSAVNVESDVPIIHYIQSQMGWAEDLKLIHNSIVVLDEDADFIVNEKGRFIRLVKNSDNYFIVIGRHYSFPELPYSMKDICVFEEDLEARATGRVCNRLQPFYKL